ncbi:tetratricopeptide repeat protein [Vulgatibacter incomptus]|uniref:TPR domain protein, putative component of TonB system n=1 Tax=Vulgatibacter incomptus TaxID=1391653 RepID=A0A0K1PF20_9BACT|nr:tetratricopeptide repeat protein [Vulgatibacter incomptus]AKU92128.1 TPR domain protein, putative component of TonB system [Vulgatibacter incomptus]
MMSRAFGFSALAALLLCASGCASTRVVQPPAPEDEIARLQRNVTKVRFAIQSTKDQIDRSRGQAYLPDLYLRLAELHVEEARYHYFIAYEGQKRREKAVTSVQARLLKERAVGIYERILQEFPDFADRDKVLFFISHEYRELGEFDKMREFLRRITTEHPQSRYRNEALLVLGDYHFDRSELDDAERSYQSILASPESGTHAMARYKLAWVRINRLDHAGALKLFEEAITKLLDEGEEGGSRRIDLRREALIDLVFPYTEVHKKPVEQLAYFRRLADSRTTYLAALSKLGRRWFVKGEFALAGQVYRELLALGADDEDSVEWVQRLYDGVLREKRFDFVAQDVRLVCGVYAARRYDWRLGAKEKENLRVELEAYARDLATKGHQAAKDHRDETLFARVGDAYDTYLAFFADQPASAEIRMNLAEVRTAAGQSLLAGRAWERVMQDAPEAERQSATVNAVSSYAKSLEQAHKLARLEQAQARSGLRKAARVYLASWPRGADRAGVKFQLARTFYDEARYDDAAELFAALVEEYPSSPEGEAAAELALDSLRSREDFGGLVVLARRMASNERIPPKVRADLMAMASGAESRALEGVTLAAGSGGEGMVDGLMAFASSHQGSSIGERALVNAFITARNSDDLEQVVEVGERLLRDYPDTEVAPDVLASLGKMSVQAADFQRAARYFDEAAARQKDPAARTPTLRAAGTLMAYLGDGQGARRAFGAVLSGAASDAAREEVALTFAELLELSGDWAGSADVLGRTRAAGVGSARLEFRLGQALARLGRGGDAASHFERAAAISSADPEQAEAVAGARYLLAAPAYDQFASIRFGGGADAQVIQAKFAALSRVEGAMVDVIERQSAQWALAALGRLAMAYDDAATFLEKAPLPAGVDEAGGARYRAALASRAEDYRSKSQEAISTCAAKAGELKVFTAAARACLSGKPLAGEAEDRVEAPARRGAPRWPWPARSGRGSQRTPRTTRRSASSPPSTSGRATPTRRGSWWTRRRRAAPTRRRSTSAA